MEDNFKLEIISPENIIFSDDVKMVTIPSYEGDMSILKNHIPIITFLRPGKIKIKKKDSNFEELEVTLKVDERLHREIQDEIGLISRLDMEKTDKFTVNISKIKFTFIK